MTTHTTATNTKTLVKLPGVGKGRLLWIADDGAHVAAGALIARFVVGSVSHDVLSPAEGRLYRVTPDGITMQGGVPIGRVHTGEIGAPAIPQKPVEAPARHAATKTPHTAAENRQARPLVQAGEAIEAAAPPDTIGPDKGRRRNPHMGPAEASLTVLESGAASVPKGKGRKRTKHTVYHVTEEQAARVASLSFLFKSNPEAPNYSESEIIRAAVEHLLNQDRPTIEAILSHNRNREKGGGYGAGWKRPGKGRK